ncbi:NmrA family NAD(P)-binding protein [Candidatus Mycobacterium methanotrophicum]|uniref:NmrA family NAD(P)-binding protein n=1 Tax=Candidatus Mycobacterium methanotrophicum TaxID=2943498 RepID=UPI001C59EB16|nr:NmrA family NAD(P)-binding protein [Candidatus Mycobacterium methanotrophicum]
MTSSGVVAVVGATGQQGGATARALLAAGASVRALVRDPQKPVAQELAAAGAQLVVADLDDPATIRAAFNGASRVFAMTTMMSGRGTAGETADGIAIADAAKATSVQHLVYSSVAGADRHTGIPHFDSKRRVENISRSFVYQLFS